MESIQLDINNFAMKLLSDMSTVGSADAFNNLLNSITSKMSEDPTIDESVKNTIKDTGIMFNRMINQPGSLCETDATPFPDLINRLRNEFYEKLEYPDLTESTWTSEKWSQYESEYSVEFPEDQNTFIINETNKILTVTIKDLETHNMYQFEILMSPTLKSVSALNRFS